MGCEVTPHKQNHDYRVVDNFNFPIYHPDWGVRVQCSVHLFRLLFHEFAFQMDPGSGIMEFVFYHGFVQADEEALLLEAIDLFGPGNWVAVADHVGNKPAAACKASTTSPKAAAWCLP